MFHKLLLSTILSLFIGGFSWAAEDSGNVLSNCFKGHYADFTADSLDRIHINKHAPVMLTSKEGEIIGFMQVDLVREATYPYAAKQIKIQQLELCSTLEVDVFYYANGDNSDLSQWVSLPFIEILQDEGLIRFKVELVNKTSVASEFKATFFAYDVFTDPEDLEKQKDLPHFVEDWGAPKGSGTFYYHVSNNWML